MSRISQQERHDLRQKYPFVKLVTVSDESGEKHDFVFQPIDRGLMDIAGKQMTNSPTSAMGLQMVTTCVFGDKKLIESNDFVFRGLLAKWETIQSAATVELGEL